MENEIQKTIANQSNWYDDYIFEHERTIVNHINFIKQRNPPKWYIAQDLESNFGGWRYDENLAKLVDKYIEMYR